MILHMGDLPDLYDHVVLNMETISGCDCGEYDDDYFLEYCAIIWPAP